MNFKAQPAQTRPAADRRIRFLSEKVVYRASYLDSILAAFEVGSFQPPRLFSPTCPYPLESGVNAHRYFEAPK